MATEFNEEGAYFWMPHATSFVLTGGSSWGRVMVGAHWNVMDYMGELTHTFSFAKSC